MLDTANGDMKTGWYKAEVVPKIILMLQTVVKKLISGII